MNKNKNNMPPVQPISISRFFRVEPGAGKDAAKINRSLVAPVLKVPKDDVHGWFYSR